MLQREVKWGVRVLDALVVVLLTGCLSIGGFYAKRIHDHETRIAVLETAAPTVKAQTDIAVNQAAQAEKLASAVKQLDHVVAQLGIMQREQTELIKAVERMTARLEIVRSP